MKSSSLVGQLLRWQVMATVGTWAVLAVLLMFVLTRHEAGDLDQRMRYFARLLAESCAAESSVPAMAHRAQVVEDIFFEGLIRFLDREPTRRTLYQILDAQGRLLVRSPGAPMSPMAASPGIDETTLAGELAHVARVESSDGKVSVIVAETASTRREALLRFLRTVGMGQVVILVVCVAAIWVSAKRGLRPLRSLASEVAARRPGDLDPIPRTHSFLEVEPLLAAVNDLLAQERARISAGRAFLADAAHELRTPLAAIVSQAHLVSVESDEARRLEATAHLNQGIDRVSHLITQLLTVARLESPMYATTRARIDVVELTRQRIADFVPRARAQGLALTLNAPDTLSVMVNAEGWVSMVDNLIDNAVRYARPARRIEITITPGVDTLQLEVADDGRGIPREHMGRVFERFHRVPGNEQPGVGLGLAIVRSVAEAHLGRVRLEPGLDGQGARFIIVIPSTG